MIAAAVLWLFFHCGCFYLVARKTGFKCFIHVKRLANSLLIPKGLGLLFLFFGLLTMILAAGIVKGVILTVTVWTSMGSLLLLFVPFLKRKREA